MLPCVDRYIGCGVHFKAGICDIYCIIMFIITKWKMRQLIVLQAALYNFIIIIHTCIDMSVLRSMILFYA